MQKDFHYYCIGVLARAAGFVNQDSLTIAHASQYVDDSTESELIPLQTQEGDLRLDPVRTAYTLLEAAWGKGWPAQKRVWIPFHFLPPEPFDPAAHGAFSFVTRPGSPFACRVLERAASEPTANNTHRLCRIGVALHTYADSWSHHGFSGRENRTENDVTGIRLLDRATGEWEHPGPENVWLDACPQIGHAEAGFYPDLAGQAWQCALKRSGLEIQRDNLEEFLTAARSVYDQLRGMPKTGSEVCTPWDQVEQPIRELLAWPAGKPELFERLSPASYQRYHKQELEKRCEAWKSRFRALFGSHAPGYSYERRRWRQEALEGDVDWDDYRDEEWARLPAFRVKAGFWASPWVQFHRAALRQRHFVLENLP